LFPKLFLKYPQKCPWNCPRNFPLKCPWNCSRNCLQNCPRNCPWNCSWNCSQNCPQNCSEVTQLYFQAKDEFSWKKNTTTKYEQVNNEINHGIAVKNVVTIYYVFFLLFLGSKEKSVIQVHQIVVCPQNCCTH
jgi:hypothetical protein